MLTRRSQDSGFTLIEVVIAMVLSTLVVAMIVGAVIKFFGSAERSGSKALAQKSAIAAADLLTNDLRAMQAPHRQPRYFGSQENLRRILLAGKNDEHLLVHDLLVAHPRQLTFFAEVVSGNTAPECVTWRLTGATGAMRREVRRLKLGTLSSKEAENACRTSSPTLPVIQTAEVMPAIDERVAIDQLKPFRFTRLVQPRPDRAFIDPSLCTVENSPGPLDSDWKRDQVVGMTLDLRSFVVTRNSRGEQNLTTAVAINSRQSGEYRYAIGCAG